MPISSREIVRRFSHACRLRSISRPSASSVRGFTLFHLLTIIALMGTLSALAAPVVFPAPP